MRRAVIGIVGLFLAVPIFSAEAVERIDYNDELDKIMVRLWEKQGLKTPDAADDFAFYRRLSFRVLGKLPKREAVLEFVKNKTPGKRAELIDKWLESTDYAMLMAMRYADMFRIKSEFPINLWPNAVQCYHRYFYDAALQDRSWKIIARELLLSNGSNFRIPPANFFRANANRKPEGLAAGTALALMGFRTDAMKKEDLEAFAAFFSRVRFKSTKEWKEEIVYNAPENVVLKCRTPDGRTFRIDTAENDPREVFADWLTDEDNPFFCRAYVNRVWYWMFGRGIIEEVDDLPLPRGFWEKYFGSSSPRANDPIDEELLDFLTDYFRKHDYSTKKLCRLILNSRAWQAGVTVPAGKLAAAEKYFAVYPVRRLESELINDALGQLTGSFERYVSVIPEPFTFIPPGTPAVTLADGSMSTGTLDKFGRSPRDSGKIGERNNRSTGAQRLHLMNSGRLYGQITRMPGRFFRGRLNWQQRIDIAYLTILSRYPVMAERKSLDRYYKSLPRNKKNRFWTDLFWALINTSEFSYHH